MKLRSASCFNPYMVRQMCKMTLGVGRGYVQGTVDMGVAKDHGGPSLVLIKGKTNQQGGKGSRGIGMFIGPSSMYSRYIESTTIPLPWNV